MQKSIIDERYIVFNGGSGNDGNKNVPEELLNIADYWRIKSSHNGDKGACVIGAKMEFTYKGKEYKMFPQSPWQGEGAWTPFVNEIKDLLETIGAEDIYYHHGRLD